MMDAFQDGGVMMWPLLVIGVGVLALGVRTALLLARGPVDRAEVRHRLGSVLFWGGMALLLGFLGTVVGVVMAARSIQAVGHVDPSLAWAGIGVTLITLIFGLLISILAGSLWFGLNAWSRRGAGADHG